MAAVIAYTLPAMQLVCHLVASGSSGLNLTGPVPATTQSPPLPEASTQSPPQLQTSSLPEGYVAYPDIGFAYKYHSDDLSWVQARNVCIREGAQLAVIDSAKKGEYLGREVTLNWVQAGILRVDDEWVNINTGDIKSSLPWRTDQPKGSGDCVQFNTGEGLINIKCSDPEDFFCEIPILAITANYTKKSIPPNVTELLNQFGV